MIKTEKYLCICTNKYGICTRVFSANRMAKGRDEALQIAKELGIWMDEDEVLIHPLSDLGGTFILP